jgi:arginyl-tRNA synthetase
VILVQLVRLIKNGEVVRMSKRTGKSIQLSDLIDEVGADSARFIFNTHEADSGMDFDLDLAVKHDSQNPVYYVQYAYTRICSVFRQLNDEIKSDYEKSETNLSVLKSESEKRLIYFMASYSLELLKSATSYDPTKITRYAINLATLFHKFYSSCKIISDDKDLMYARLSLCDCVRIIIKNILDMFEVKAPEIMD